jgi:hypothetical protein
MRKLIYILTLGCILTSCNDGTNTKNDNANQTVSADTITNEYDATDHKTVIEKKDTVLIIDNEKFTLSYSAKIEPSKLFYHTDIYADKGKNHKDIYKGFNATYNILLTDNLGKFIFSKTLTKNNFKEIFEGSILTRTDSKLPYFIGYLNNFNSFLFSIDFWVPDSDVGGQCFFMINKKGDLTENSLNNYYGGADCDGEIEIPKNKNFILTCRKILNTNGNNIEISDKRFWQVGTKLVNDNIILVIQEHNDTTNTQNAKLIDNFGKTLKTFTYKGYYEVLGYTVPLYLDTLNSNYILLDEEQKNLRVINKKQPLSTYTVAFDKMKPFDNDKLKSEIIFDLNTEFSNNTFTFDTSTNSFRHRKNKKKTSP